MDTPVPGLTFAESSFLSELLPFPAWIESLHSALEGHWGLASALKGVWLLKSVSSVVNNGSTVLAVVSHTVDHTKGSYGAHFLTITMLSSLTFIDN